MMYIAVFAISVLIGCGVSVFILALFNADAPTREDYDTLKFEWASWRRMALTYKQKYEEAQRLQEVWKSSAMKAMKRGETDAEEPHKPQE